MENNVEILEHLEKSDHNITVWKLICDVGLSSNNKLVRKYNKVGYNSMRDRLKCIDWVMKCSDSNVVEMWLKFCSIIDWAINMFVPLGQDRNRKTPSWMNKLANSARKYKSRMWNRYRQFKSYNDLVEYKLAPNKAV